MERVVLLTTVLVGPLLAAAVLFGRSRIRRPRRVPLSAVTQQHLHLFQGGRLGEAAVEAAKARLRELLRTGGAVAAEAGLRSGEQYVVQVQALAELGGRAAVAVLENQLQYPPSGDPIERDWYRLDLAQALRQLDRPGSVPHLLRCPAGRPEMPLAQFFAAETVCCSGFMAHLRRPATPLGRAAVRTLHLALRGLRHGLSPHIFAEGRLGEAAALLWQHRLDTVEPLLVRVLAESLRQLQRSDHTDRLLRGDPAAQSSGRRQVACLKELEPAFSDYLREAPALLGAALPGATDVLRGEVLEALADLRADAARSVMPLLDELTGPQRELAVRLMTWSRDPRVAPQLCAWAVARLRPAWRWLHVWSQGHRPAPGSQAFAAVLRALRGHPSVETEAFLLHSFRDRDSLCRTAAVSSLGWWEPIRRDDVLRCLHRARHDRCAEVGEAARAALARLGERQALQWFRQALTGETVIQVHEAVQRVASEGLTWLWPDLDRLADAENGEVAAQACEALERLREELVGSPP